MSLPLLAAVKRTRLVRWIELAVVVVVAIAATLPPMLTTPRVVHDSESYLSLSRYRLPVVPLLYGALGHNLVAIVVVQAVIGGFCWSYLALEALRITRRPWCYVAFASVLLISCSDYVSHWYRAVLSDSLSLSLLALLLASLSSWLAGRGSLARLMIVALLWAGTRNTNGYLLLLAGFVGLLIVLVRHRRLSWLMATGVAIAGGLAVVWATGNGGLGQQAFEHVLTERILTDPAKVAWFKEHGMPVTPALRRLAGPWLQESNLALTNSPALASFRVWMENSGERTYVEYIIFHPWWAFAGTFEPPLPLNGSNLTLFTGFVARPWVPALVRQLFLVGFQTTLLVASAVTAVLMLVRRRVLTLNRDLIVWWSAVVFAGYLGLVIDWIGDPLEVARHSIGPVVQIWVALSFLGAIALGGRPKTKPVVAGPTAQPITRGEQIAQVSKQAVADLQHGRQS